VSDAVSLSLEVRPPFAGDALLAWLAARAVPGVEEVVGDVYRRVVAVEGGHAILEVQLGVDRAVARARPVGCVAGTPLGGGRATHPAADRLARVARSLIDADADPAAIVALLGCDPVLGPLVRAAPGLRRPGTVDPAELAIRAVLGQQVSVPAARTLAGRLAADLGEPVTDAAAHDPAAHEPAARRHADPAPRHAAPTLGLSRAFPTPAALAALDAEDLPMPRARGRALIGLARALADGAVVLDQTTDPAAAREALLALPGIGPWTADYIALRALGDRDAFPASDLVILQAAGALGLPDAPRALLARAQAWRPLRAYAAHHLWASRG